MQRHSVLSLTKGNDFLHVLSVIAWGSEAVFRVPVMSYFSLMASYHLQNKNTHFKPDSDTFVSAYKQQV